MKKRTLLSLGIVLIIIFAIGMKINSDIEKVAEVFHVEHDLEGADILLISEAVSPNEKHTYYQYQFDHGGFGYSRVFWSVIETNDKVSNLEKGLIPDGFKIVGWTSENELILEKWKPNYDITTTALKNRTELNGVKIILSE